MIRRELDNVGIAWRHLFKLLEEVRGLEGCEKGVAVIMYGHGDPNYGILFPLVLSNEERLASGLPERDIPRVPPGHSLLPGPGQIAPGLPGARSWDDVWRNVRAVHAKACWSDAGSRFFGDINFTGYEDPYNFPAGAGGRQRNYGPLPADPAPKPEP